MSFGTKSAGDTITSAWKNLLESALGSGNPAQGASYVVFYDSSDSLYKARNGLDGTIDSSNATLLTVVQAANDALTSGGTIYLKEQRRPNGLTISSDVRLLEYYQNQLRDYRSTGLHFKR